jgi:50S ribosomal protein L16 3-hydroxylase
VNGGLEAEAAGQSFVDRAHDLITLLRELGAGRVEHGSRGLLEHLEATARVLDRWGAGERVCKAGLFHAVYGTEYLRQALLSFDARPRLQARIGAEAERLAYIFCTLDRASIYRAIDGGEPYVVTAGQGRESTAVTPDEIRSLLLILWANGLAQATHVNRPDDVRRREARTIARYAAFFPERALRDLQASTGTPPAIAARRGLAPLFNLGDPAPFLDAWPDRPFLGAGPVERLAGLIDYSFDEVKTMARSYARAFPRSADGGAAPVNITAGQERAYYEAGYTVYFHGLRSDALDRWVSAIDDDLGLLHGVTRVSAFASRRGAGLRPHYDQNDNFVCQARGAKRWRIARSRHVRFPTVGYTVGTEPTPAVRAEAPDGLPDDLPAPHDTLELLPGHVMFMPRGTWHDTETLEGESLHFNIQAGLATWKDMLEFAIGTSSALHREDLRAPVLRMFEGDAPRDGLRDELKEKLGALLAAMCSGEIELDRGAFLHFMARRRSAL